MAILSSGEPLGALIFVLLAAFFDFFDGLAARSLKAYSPIGKDLDSLADMVSFGVAPAIVGVRYQMYPFVLGESPSDYDSSVWLPEVLLAMASFVLPLLIAVFSALRLAKFNNDKRQTENFIGLATPACAILYVSLITVLRAAVDIPYGQSVSESSWSLMANGKVLWHWCYWIPVVIAPVLCWLLVSEIPMFSMKFRNLSWPDNRDRYIFLLIVAVEIAMALIGGYSFPALLVAVITTYIIINLLMLAFRKKATSK
jgi:CDP-diacylglycerol--serine O-phosphatidyltransferase